MTEAQRQRDEECSSLADFLAVYRLYRRNGHKRIHSLRKAWHCIR